MMLSEGKQLKCETKMQFLENKSKPDYDGDGLLMNDNNF